MISTLSSVRTGIPVAIMVLFGLLGSGVAPAQEQPGSDPTADVPPYTVNPGDILSVTVWKEPDLQRRVIVRPDGAFSFPLTGDIRAAGRSIEQIRIAVAERLEKYIPEPVVTVAVEEIAGNVVYVIGQVNRPGDFRTGSRVDVMQALAMGGGTTPFAQLGDIKILRRVGGRLIAIPFDYKDVEKGKRLEQNIVLQAGDVVVVP
jgi:polysaccharide export outer membrane protein